MWLVCLREQPICAWEEYTFCITGWEGIDWWHNWFLVFPVSWFPNLHKCPVHYWLWDRVSIAELLLLYILSKFALCIVWTLLLVAHAFMTTMYSCCLFLCLFFRDRVSLYSSGYPGTHSVDQAGLELRNSPASASQVLELKACATMPSCILGGSNTFILLFFGHVNLDVGENLPDFFIHKQSQ